MGNMGMRIICKKSLVLVIAITIAAFGISLFYAANIGTDPISVLVDGEHNLLNQPYGTVTLINNIVLIIFGLIFARKYVHIGTIIGGLLTGPLINFFVPLLSGMIPETTPYLAKLMLLFPAVIFMGGGIAMVISIRFGVGTMDLLTLSIRDITKIDLKWIKMGLDVIYTGAGYLMGGVIGAGTIIGVLLTGPIIGFVLPRSEKLLGKWLELEPAQAQA